jgi:hypothetical protein
MKFLAALKKTFRPTHPNPAYRPLGPIETAKQHDSHTQTDTLHPSELDPPTPSPRVPLLPLPHFPTPLHVASRRATIAYDAELQDLYDATMEFLADGEKPQDRRSCVPFELPDDEFLDAWVSGPHADGDTTWLAACEAVGDCAMVEVWFDVDLDVGVNDDGDGGGDGVQRATGFCPVYVGETASEMLPLRACVGDVTVQEVECKALQALKEPGLGNSRLGAYFDLERQQMIEYMALDYVCSLKEAEVSSVASDETVGSDFSDQFFEFPEPDFDHDYSEAADSDQDTTAEKSGPEQLDEHSTKVRIPGASSGDVCLEASTNAPLEPQLQVEHDGQHNKHAFALSYEHEHGAARLKRRNPAVPLRLVDLETIEEADEPCSTGSGSFVLEVLGCMLDPYNDAEPGGSFGTECSVESSPIVTEQPQLPGQMFPSPQVLNEVTTEVDGLLTNILERLDRGRWDELPALGCDIHSALHALSAEYPVLGMVERLGATVETLVESVAALESVHIDLLGGEGGASTNS